MKNKDILLNALASKPTPRVPWVPFVGAHGGALINKDATAYLQSSKNIFDGLKLATQRYRPDGLPVVFDLQIEAEILGCQLAWAKETPPSVISHPLGEDYNLDELPPFSTGKGRMPQILEAVRRFKAEIGDEVALYGLITGPLTLALHLRGDDLLLDMFDEDQNVPRLLDFCAAVGEQMTAAYIEAGVDVIAVVDPMISQIGSGHFISSVAPPLNRLFDGIRDRGALSSLFVCGNATRNLEAMCQCRCDNISVDENVDLSELARTARAAGKSFGGNLQLTVVLLLGDTEDARRDALRCLDQAGEGNGFILAPGCDLPYAVKPENLESIANLVHDPYQLEVARNLPPKTTNDMFEDVVIPDYKADQNVIIDVITLDSGSCAPCTYMVSAAREAAQVFNRPVDVREHKITTREGLGYMTKLQVSAVPSICVDGQERFASLIPSREDLVQSLESAASSK